MHPVSPNTGRLTLAWIAALAAPVGWFVLAVAAAFSPEAIANGDHLRALRIPIAECLGCGFCGMSRAFSLAMHGQWSAAWAMNPGCSVLLPGFLLAATTGPVVFWCLAIRGPQCTSPH